MALNAQAQLKKNLGVTSCFLALVHNKKLSYRRDSVRCGCRSLSV